MNRAAPVLLLLLFSAVLLPAQNFPDITAFSQLKTVLISLCEPDEGEERHLPPCAAWKKYSDFPASSLRKTLYGKWDSTLLSLMEKQNRNFLSIQYRPGDDASRLIMEKAIQGMVREISFLYRSDTDIKLKIIIEDIKGFIFKIPVTIAMAKNWVWYKVAVPPFIDQMDFFNSSRSGCYFRGFEFPAGKEAFELELDLVMAATDLFQLENRDPDFMEDNW